MKTIRRICKILSVVSVGVTMIGATVMGALAVDLSDYPEPFFSNGVFDESTTIVVGSKAAASDTLGAIKIATNLAQVGKAETKYTGISEEVFLGEKVNDEIKTIENYDLSKLKDGYVNFDDKEYDYHEEINFGDNLLIQTSLTSNEDIEEPFLQVKKGDLQYNFVFDESIDMTKATKTNELEIEFLGNKMSIIDVKDDNTLTAYVGNSYYMKVDDVVTVDNKKVTLTNVGIGGAIVVEVDGVFETIKSDSTKTVNGIEISNVDTFYEQNKNERMANLVIGKDSLLTIDDGDEYVSDVSDWNWVLKDLNTNTPILGIKNDFNYYKETQPIATEGKSYVFPNSYVSVYFDSLNTDNYRDYTLNYDTEDLSDISNYPDDVKVYSLSSVKDSFRMNNNRASKIIVYPNNTNYDVFYIDINNDLVFSKSYYNETAEIGKINYEDSKLGVELNTNDKTLKINDFKIELNNGIKKVTWKTKDLSNSDNNLMDEYGIKLKNPENAIDENELVLNIPNKQLKAEITVTSELTKETTNYIGEIDINTMLDTEITNPEQHNLILVGGPCADPLVGAILGLPDCETYKGKYHPGQAIIQIVKNDGKVALLVAGWEAKETRIASEILSKDSSKLNGDLCVIQETIDEPVIDCEGD